jgi:ubiquinone/menaquinone biosynthesis C-methylase UbiE
VPQPNYFANAEVAARYERVRPFYHREVVAQIARLAGVQRFRAALDVGCGTGKSSVALAEIAEHVTAIDSSAEMLSQAPACENITYRVGSAEQLQFADGSFDLITVGAALHWFDAARFYSECRRVLVPGGQLAIYNDHFTAHMRGNDEFKRWVRRRFLKRYRRPAKRMTDFDEDIAAQHEFRVVNKDAFEHLVPFSREEFAAYLLTHTNTLSVIEAGRETTEEAMEWLNAELVPHVGDTPQLFVFKCNLWLLGM